MFRQTQCNLLGGTFEESQQILALLGTKTRFPDCGTESKKPKRKFEAFRWKTLVECK